MTWLSPKNWLRAGLVSLAIFINSYLGAQRWSPNRSYVPGHVQDARFDAPEAVRTELVRKSRYFERNNAIVNRIADLFEQYTVGTVIPDSSDDDYNELLSEAWDAWQRFPDLTSRQTFATLCSLVARSWEVDGEIFILLTRGETPPYRPRIQLIETHRIHTPPHLSDLEGKTIIEGIEIDSKGRPTAYWMRDGLDMAAWKRIEARWMIHVAEPSRTGQMRGLPFCYPVIPDMCDLEDLQGCEMLAAKDAAEKAFAIINESGTISAEQLRRNRFAQVTQTSTGTEVTEQRLEHIAKRVGGRSIALKKGEDIKQIESNRPNGAALSFWDHLTAKICIGHGIPHLLVFPRSLQGTVARGELDIAATFFRTRAAVLGDAFRRVYEYVMAWETTYNPKLIGGPEDGSKLKCITRAPRSVNVDAGRNSAAMLAELEGGARTYEDVYAELGKDWRREIRQRAKEEAFIEKMAVKFGVPADRIRRSISESLRTEMQTAAQQQDKEDNEQVLTA